MRAADLPLLRPLMEARGHEPGRAAFTRTPGAAAESSPDAADAVAAEVRASGRPDGVVTRPLVTQPHPRRWGLYRATWSPAPWVWLTDRMTVVTWQEGGRTRTLLWGPTDHERDRGTSAMAQLRSRLPVPADAVSTHHGTAIGHVRALGIDPLDVDYLLFDHLHTQDVRRLLGTPGVPADLDAEAPLRGWFPNATLLVQRAEWETVTTPHALQSPWYQSATFDDLDADRIELLDGDHLLGPGVAVLCTPGHTAGNQTLVLHTGRGVELLSGNGVAVDAWLPAASRIPGVRAHAVATGQQAVPRASTLEFASWQHVSMAVEERLADRDEAGRFPLIHPTGELTPHLLAPLLSPTVRHGGCAHGLVLPSPAATEPGLGAA